MTSAGRSWVIAGFCKLCSSIFYVGCDEIQSLRFDVVREIIKPFPGNLDDGESRCLFLLADVCNGGLVEGNAKMDSIAFGVIYLCTVAKGAVVFAETDDGDGRWERSRDHDFSRLLPFFPSHP